VSYREILRRDETQTKEEGGTRVLSNLSFHIGGEGRAQSPAAPFRGKKKENRAHRVLFFLSKQKKGERKLELLSSGREGKRKREFNPCPRGGGEKKKRSPGEGPAASYPFFWRRTLGM